MCQRSHRASRENKQESVLKIIKYAIMAIMHHLYSRVGLVSNAIVERVVIIIIVVCELCAVEKGRRVKGYSDYAWISLKLCNTFYFCAVKVLQTQFNYILFI